MDMQKFEVAADAKVRAMAFLDAYIAAPSDAELTFQLGRDEHGTPAMVITLSGVKHAFTEREARGVANIAQGPIVTLTTHDGREINIFDVDRHSRTNQKPVW